MDTEKHVLQQRDEKQWIHLHNCNFIACDIEALIDGIHGLKE